MPFEELRERILFTPKGRRLEQQHISLSKKRLFEQRLFGFFVPVGKVGFPVPESPEDVALFGKRPDLMGVAGTACWISESAGAEFTQVDGPAARFPAINKLLLKGIGALVKSSK